MKTLAEELDLALSGVPTYLRLVNLILLAMELEFLRHVLHYAGGGAWQAHRKETLEGSRLTWAAYCITQGGITNVTANNYVKCGRVLMERMRLSDSQEDKEILALMQQMAPSLMTPAQRNQVKAHLALMVLRGADTMSSLRREFNKQSEIRKPNVRAEVIDAAPRANIVDRAEELRAMALKAGVGRPFAARVAMSILAKDWLRTGSPNNIVRFWKREAQRDATARECDENGK